MAELKEAQGAVYDFMEQVDEDKAEGAMAVAEAQAEITAKREALKTFTDVGELRNAQQEINNKEQDVELLKQVTENKVTAMKGQLEELVVAFFAVHKSATFLFRAVDNHLVANTSLSELAQAKATMSGHANTLQYAFSGVRQVLLDEKIVSNQEQNKNWRGTHLGQRIVTTELDVFESKIRSYIHTLKVSGIEIK
jgi:hypothetical protein